MNIEEMRQKLRTATQVSSKCERCKGVTACFSGDMKYNGCILDRKAGACEGPFETWDKFNCELEKEIPS